MRKARLLRIIGSVGALAVLGLPMALAPRDAQAQQVLTVQLRAQGGSGQTGTAVLTSQGNRTLVVIQTSGGPGGIQPAHFHRGTCANLDPQPAVPLNNLQNGRSETVVDVPITTLANGQHSINVHFSPQQLSVYTACGEVPAIQLTQQPTPPTLPAPPAPPAVPPAAPTPAPAAPADVPQFGGANTLAWPPVFSGELQATVGNATVIVGLVGNRTLREHAFVDVRWWLPTTVRVLDSYAGNNPGVNRGKLEGLSAAAQQLGWVNHFVRQGQVQGPFYILVDNSGRSFRVWSWLWFSTASDEPIAGSPPGTPVLRRNGNYTSRGVEAGASPLGWSAEFNTAAAGAGVAALAPSPAPAR